MNEQNTITIDTDSILSADIATWQADKLLGLPYQIPHASKNPLLKKKIKPFETPMVGEVQPGISFSDAAKYLVTMMINKGGVGLAANQLGLEWRMFAFVDTSTGKPINRVMVNPSVIRADGKLVTIKEGCLSYPSIFYNVKRRQYVSVDFYDAVTGKNVIETFGGMTARIVLHEYDHLEGKVMADRL